MALPKRLIDNIGLTAFALVLVGTALFAIIPPLVGVILSFDQRDYIGPFPPPDYSLRWYQEFFDNPTYLQGLRTSLIVALSATGLSLLAGIPASVFISRYRFRGRDLLQTVLLSPLIIPTVVTGLGVLLFAAKIGILDGMTRLIIGHLIITIPYVIRASLASLAGIPPALEEAALSLGSNERQAFFDITLPLAKTGIMAGAVFAFVMSFDEVAISLFLSDPFTFTLPVALLAEMRANLNLTIAAVSTMFILFMLVLILVLDHIVGVDRVVGQGVYRG